MEPFPDNPPRERDDGGQNSHLERRNPAKLASLCCEGIPLTGTVVEQGKHLPSSFLGWKASKNERADNVLDNKRKKGHNTKEKKNESHHIRCCDKACTILTTASDVIV